MAVLDVAKLRAEFSAPHELVTTSDGRTLFLRHWGESGRSDLAVLIFHGITAYSEPYGKLLAEELARAGLQVFGLDLRGHGRSDGNRGDLPSGERLSRDLCETVAFLRARFPRVVVLGHSLGVLSALIAFNRCPEGIDGLVLVSVGRQVRPGVYGRPTAWAALKMLFGVALFRSRPWIGYYREGMLGRDDPLFNFRYSARFYSATYGMSPWAVARMLRQNVIDSPNLHPTRQVGIPVLVAIGDQDEMFSIESSRGFFDKLDATRKEFLVVPGGHHASFPPASWGPLAVWLSDKFPPLAARSVVPQ
jgi:acylglycerol lipase